MPTDSTIRSSQRRLAGVIAVFAASAAGAAGPGPSNDLCSGAIAVAIPSTTVGTTIGATVESPLPPVCDTAGPITAPGVWYSLVGNGALLTLSLCGSAFDTRLEVYCTTSPTPCASVSSLACTAGNDDSCGTQSVVTFCSALNQTYYILVHGYGAGEGAFALSVTGGAPCGNPTSCVPTPPPANDLCTGAINLGLSAGGSVAIAGTTFNAEADPAAPACGLVIPPQTTGALGVWYTFTGTGNRVHLDTCGQSADLVLRVYCGTCASLACAASDDDGCTSNTLAPSLTVCTSPGVAYFVLVSHYGAAVDGASFILNASDDGAPCTGAPSCGGVAPPNDTCAGAITIPVGATVSGTVIDASADSPPPCGAITGSMGVWYTFAGDGSRIRVSTCNAGTGSGTTINVFTGSCAGLVCVGGSDATSPPCPSRNDAATFDFCSTAGRPYWVLVTQGADGAGLFQLSVQSVAPCPANDNCAGALRLTIGAPVTGDTTFANTESPAPPSCQGLSTFNLGLWYSVVGNGHLLRTTTCDPSTVLDTRVYVYTGACDALSCVGAGTAAFPACSPATAASVRFCSTVGQTYYVLVTNDTTGVGVFRLVVSDLGACQPNDSCAGATTVAVPSATVLNTDSASFDPGVGQCPPADPFATVAFPGLWYRVIGNGHTFRADTCNTAAGTYDTRLSVFCGYGAGVCASPAALLCITGIDNATDPPPAGCGAGSQQSLVTWCTQPGTPYLILVHGGVGALGPTGTATLTLADLGPCGAAAACAATGACCTAGACSTTTAAACTGFYFGDGTTCFPPAGPPTTYTRTPALPIPDNQCTSGYVSDTINIADSYTISDLNVNVQIPAHTYIGDLAVALAHNNTTVRLWLFECSFNDNLSVTFDDEGAPVVCASPQIGTFRPVDPLSAFDGMSIAGAWTIRVCDGAGADTGTLTSWSLIATPSGPNPCSQGPDCFTRGPAGAIGTACAAPIPTHARPQNAGHFKAGGADGGQDSSQCIGDWDGDGCVAPSDVAQFILSWFFSANNPPNTDADLDCDGVVAPADVATFITRWFGGLTAPLGEGCV